MITRELTTIVENADLHNEAYLRRVEIKFDEGEYVSNAYSVECATGNRIHQGCVVHEGLDDHIERAENWVDYNELYFF